jgi:hypothetical protein
LLLFYFFRRDQKNIFEGNAITFLIPRTTSRFFFALLTTHRRIYFSALEGLLRPEALASIGLSGVFVVDSDAKRRKNSVFGTLAPNGGRHK